MNPEKKLILELMLQRDEARAQVEDIGVALSALEASHNRLRTELDVARAALELAYLQIAKVKGAA